VANFLIIKNNKIVNVVVADTQEIAEEVTSLEAIESTSSEPWIGWTRDNGVWSAPVVPEENPTE
jgi:hypothetical protein